MKQVLCWAMVAAMGVVALAADDNPKDVPFDTYDGYFVSNKYEPDADQSFVAARDAKAFDQVFGVGFVLNDKRRRLPDHAFDSKIAVAAIKRGKSIWTYKVKSVTSDGDTVTVRYAAEEAPQASGEFASPLILSIPRGDYTSVRFIENGKEAKAIDLKDAAADFVIKSEKKEDAIAASAEAGQTVFTITGKSAIDRATIERKTDHWPEKVILRVRLGGLESLTLTGSDVSLNASVSSHGDNKQLLHLVKDGKEGPQLVKGARYFMEIRVMNAEGKPVDGPPKEGGWFEMQIPKALLDDKSKTLGIGWIDFYRG